MKKFYEEPELEFVAFNYADVITTSIVTPLNPSDNGDGEESGWSDLW